MPSSQLLSLPFIPSPLRVARRKVRPENIIIAYGITTYCTHVNLLQLCLILCDPMDCSPQASSVHAILLARILEWAAIPLSGDLPKPGIEPPSLGSPALAGRFVTGCANFPPVRLCQINII